MRGFIDAIKQAESKSPHWISVKDRLPEDGDMLAYSVIGDETRIVPVNYCDGKWFDCMFNRYIDTVTHWIPTPKPPEEEENDI